MKIYQRFLVWKKKLQNTQFSATTISWGFLFINTYMSHVFPCLVTTSLFVHTHCFKDKYLFDNGRITHWAPVRSDPNCVHVQPGSGRLQAQFDIYLNSCGMTTSSSGDNYGQPTPTGTYIENTVIIQYDPLVQEVKEKKGCWRICGKEVFT